MLESLTSIIFPRDIHQLAQVEATWASFGWPKSKAGWLLSNKLSEPRAVAGGCSVIIGAAATSEINHPLPQAVLI